MFAVERLMHFVCLRSACLPWRDYCTMLYVRGVQPLSQGQCSITWSFSLRSCDPPMTSAFIQYITALSFQGRPRNSCLPEKTHSSIRLAVLFPWGFGVELPWSSRSNPWVWGRWATLMTSYESRRVEGESGEEVENAMPANRGTHWPTIVAGLCQDVLYWWWWLMDRLGRLMETRNDITAWCVTQLL